jgi:hypothetical protein
MTDKEMALEIASVVLRFQMSKLALESIISLYRIHGEEPDWQPRVQRATDELLISQSFRDRIVQLKTAFDATKSADELIRTLHHELFDPSPLEYSE